MILYTRTNNANEFEHLESYEVYEYPVVIKTSWFYGSWASKFGDA